MQRSTFLESPVSSEMSSIPSPTERTPLLQNWKASNFPLDCHAHLLKSFSWPTNRSNDEREKLQRWNFLQTLVGKTTWPRLHHPSGSPTLGKASVFHEPRKYSQSHRSFALCLRALLVLVCVNPEPSESRTTAATVLKLLPTYWGENFAPQKVHNFLPLGGISDGRTSSESSESCSDVSESAAFGGVTGTTRA